MIALYQYWFHGLHVAVDMMFSWIYDKFCIKFQLEAQYKQKMAQNKRNIENEKERLKRREIELEEGLFTQRQLLLEEMEMVKMRENELKRQTEINKR